MNFQTHTKNTLTYTTLDGREVELELYHKPDSIMDYKDSLIYENANKVIIGYLSHDDDCMNPLTDCDGMGNIYSAHRNAGRDQHGMMREALGLNSDWEPDLELVCESDIVIRAHKLISESNRLHQGASPRRFIDALDYCEENYQRDDDDQTDLEFVCDCLSDYDNLREFDADWIEEVAMELWKEGRESGLYGNAWAVSLDVYEHGGVAYSVSGEGMQCQFDTARGGAVWVPDDVAEDEIVSRGKVYQKGKIIDANILRGDGNKFFVRTYAKFGEFDDVVHPGFKHWYDAYQYLKGLDESSLTYLQPLMDAQYDAARELAKQACSVYTDWCNGACYGYVVETFDLEGVEEGDEIESEDQDAVWGFVGDDHAYDSLQEAFDYQKDRL